MTGLETDFSKIIPALVPVCDGEDGLVVKLLSDGLLQQFVRLLVDAGCGFIDTQQLQDGKHRTGNTDLYSSDVTRGRVHKASW